MPQFLIFDRTTDVDVRVAVTTAKNRKHAAHLVRMQKGWTKKELSEVLGDYLEIVDVPRPAKRAIVDLPNFPS